MLFREFAARRWFYATFDERISVFALIDGPRDESDDQACEVCGYNAEKSDAAVQKIMCHQH